MERKKREIKPTVETKLTREDFKKVEELATEDGVSKSEFVRQALLWYIAHRAELKNAPRDLKITNAIEALTNRVCAMLARQGRQIGTMVELTHASMSQTKEGKAAFDAALDVARRKQAMSIEKDERDLVEAMKKTVEISGGKLNV